MTEQAGFAVPKERQEVTVLLDGGESLEGAIFLEYSLQELTIHHRIVAFLEDGTSFFPLKIQNGNETEFIQKKNVKLIELRNGPAQEAVNDAIRLMHIENITVVFSDESSLTGALMAEVPSEKARLSDCLNLPDRFLHVKAGSRICYINKEKLRKVVYAGD